MIMSYEQIIEELKRLKAHNGTNTDKQQEKIDKKVDQEVAELDATIEEYNEKIAALEAKIADESNYQYNGENEERDLTIELLEESFENQLEVMAREDEEYKSLEDLATTIFADYNLEIAQLNNDIANIERRLRKNEIAVRKNIGIQLTEDELISLNQELEKKRARIIRCEEMKLEYVEELRNYGELITANNRKREIVLAKQESLNKIKEHRASKEGSLDNAKLRNDKDELASLKAGVAALISRKDYITYNPNAEIDKLIEAIEQSKTVEDLNVGTVVPETNEVKAEINTEEINLENQIEEPTEDKAERLINAYLAGNEDELEEQEINEVEINPETLGIPEETTAHDIWMAGNPDLDTEREAEIEEASETLKDKKKTSWLRDKWTKWVAAGLVAITAIGIIVNLKGCDPKINESHIKDTNDNNSNKNNNIIVNTNSDFNEKKENEFNNKFYIPSDAEIKNQGSNSGVVKNEKVENETIKKEETNEDVKKDTTVKAKLSQGESITSIDNIIKGNINENTVINHGDEVGKTTDNAELKEYTEEGKAVVEAEKNNQQSITDNTESKDNTEETNEAVSAEKDTQQSATNKTTITREQIIKNLEEFMGGDFTPSEAGNQWIDQVTEKTR